MQMYEVLPLLLHAHFFFQFQTKKWNAFECMFALSQHISHYLNVIRCFFCSVFIWLFVQLPVRRCHRHVLNEFQKGKLKRTKTGERRQKLNEQTTDWSKEEGKKEMWNYRLVFHLEKRSLKRIYTTMFLVLFIRICHTRFNNALEPLLAVLMYRHISFSSTCSSNCDSDSDCRSLAQCACHMDWIVLCCAVLYTSTLLAIITNVAHGCQSHRYINSTSSIRSPTLHTKSSFNRCCVCHFHTMST